MLHHLVLSSSLLSSLLEPKVLIVYALTVSPAIEVRSERARTWLSSVALHPRRLDGGSTQWIIVARMKERDQGRLPGGSDGWVLEDEWGLSRRTGGEGVSLEARTRCKSPRGESAQHVEDLKSGKGGRRRAAWSQIRLCLVNQIQEVGSRERAVGRYSHVLGRKWHS